MYTMRWDREGVFGGEASPLPPPLDEALTNIRKHCTRYFYCTGSLDFNVYRVSKQSEWVTFMTINIFVTL